MSAASPQPVLETVVQMDWRFHRMAYSGASHAGDCLFLSTNWKIIGGMPEAGGYF